MLTTPDAIRELRKKLYQKAKQEKGFRFYALYDKLYRADIIRFAYQLVRAKKGSPGVDGITFEAIQGMEGGDTEYCERITEELKNRSYKPMPVKRVYIPKPDGGERPLGIPVIKDRVVQMAVKIVIEPIFEADFQNSSYGFRPGRSAHKAMDEVNFHLRYGKTQVIDADITRYFDTIPHDKLMHLIALRIVDAQVLRLIRMWLKAPIAEEDEGKKKYTRSDKGTPQGGVLSPLLANIYLNVLDKAMTAQGTEATLVRYADDFVVLCKAHADRIMEHIAGVLTDLGLTLNAAKTRVLDATRDRFTFLGFTIEVKRNPKTGKRFPLIIPSRKALTHIRREIKHITGRTHRSLPTPAVIVRLNEVVRGWTGYFYYGNCTRDFARLKDFLGERVRAHLRKKHGLQSRGYKTYSYQYLYRTLGLFKIPTTAPWTHVVKAAGRR